MQVEEIVGKKQNVKICILPNEKIFKISFFNSLISFVLNKLKIKRKTKQTIKFNIEAVYDSKNYILNLFKIISTYFNYKTINTVNKEEEIPKKLTTSILLKFSFDFKEILKYRNDVMEWLSEPKFVKKKINKLKNKNNINFDQCCAVHVRRGDFLTSDKGYASDNGWALPKKYYDLCICKLPKNLTYIFLTDDKNYVRNEFSHIHKKLISEFDDISDLYLIARCKYKILANSSFSLWGGFLGNLSDDIVYVPKYLIGWSKKNGIHSTFLTYLKNGTTK